MSSIPSSAMPHAKAHDDEDQPHDHEAGKPEAQPADDTGVQATLNDVKEKAADVQEKVTDGTTRLANSAKAEAQAHPKTGIAIGAAVAVGVAALAAIPFFLSKSDAEKPKPRKAKAKPSKGHKAND